ncbi:phosphatidylinositol 4,5-bisphosphate 5-phosphatase A-like isoform X1 [Pieris brassicae]|uniref:phosphatidylinositol 4,5-bisphosphate 5-phosphatase A-like isoform X1 n=1 Tax=Pieris brassicae TaxID=7116 RepID=UPI001E6621DD|nr:phosphatidylinositol 4,5-bisphosphate 5-phosphatase A-like isoform X1 [Pieris brassicae]
MNTLRFYFVTWNVATKNPSQDLNALLDFPSQFNKHKPLPDFYVIGLQEVKSQPQNMVMDSIFTDQWTSTFNKILCRQGFVIAKSMRLQGIVILVYTQMKHVTRLRDIQAQYTKTGFGGLWGNKGAVSVRFNLYGCSFCLVNCHLAAHEHCLSDRITSCNTILQEHTYDLQETSNILYHDYVFWIGDLNFRLEYPPEISLTPEEIVEQLQKIEKDKYASLLKYDQLFAVKDSGEALSEFTEGEIQFPPTYKYVINTYEYDLKRKPSWTDRVLYKVNADNYENITLRADLISYNHVPHYMVSDHKPVVAQFNVKVRQTFPRTVLAEEPDTKVSRSSIRMRSALVMPMNDDAGDLETPMDPIEESDAEFEPSCTSDVVDAADESFADYTEKIVEFAPISRIWYIGDADFRTECTLSHDVEINQGDWIGIFDANFHSLDDYITYDYVSKVGIQESPHVDGEARTVTLSFPVGSGVRTPGFYRFIYFSQPSNEVKSVLGISDPFEVSSKEDQMVSIDPCSEASGSTSNPMSVNTDVFTDFTGLDVAKLSRHFSNDLSID